MRGRLLQPFRLLVLLFSVPRGLSRYDSSFTRVTERRMPPKKKLKALADEKQKMLTDLFSTASIKTSRTSSEPTATTSLSVDQPSDACDQPQSQMCDPQSEITSTSATEVEDSSTQKTQKKGANRNYQDSWKAIYPFIDYDPVKKKMFCKICVDSKIAKNSFVHGCDNFRTSSIEDHVDTDSHKSALKVPAQVENKRKCVKCNHSRKERGMKQVVRTAHFITVEDLALILTVFFQYFASIYIILIKTLVIY